MAGIGSSNKYVMIVLYVDYVFFRISAHHSTYGLITCTFCFISFFVSSTTNFDMSSCFRVSQKIQFSAHCTSFLIYYKASYKENLMGGANLTLSSEPAALTFESFLVFVIFTTKSSCREFSPITCPV